MGAALKLTDWPNAEFSRFLSVRPHLWHVQEMGQGPTVLVLHGASGSTHSWRETMQDLARDHHVVAVDLPGHGYTKLGSRHRSSLPLMTQDLRALLDDQEWSPDIILAHSAGAALGIRLSQLCGSKIPLVAVNPALTPFKGVAGVLFPIAARVMAMTPFLVNMLKRRMSGEGQLVSLMETTGSNISPEGMRLYSKLFQSEDHVDGTLLMMAQWKLDGLVADLPNIHVPCTFLVGGNDKAVPPSEVARAADQMPNARITQTEGFGHLLHEEAPELVADHLRAALRRYT